MMVVLSVAGRQLCLFTLLILLTTLTRQLSPVEAAAKKSRQQRNSQIDIDKLVQVFLKTHGHNSSLFDEDRFRAILDRILIPRAVNSVGHQKVRQV